MGNQLRLDVAQLTDVGRKREHNEDNMAYVIPKDAQVMTRKGALFIVADGMGGHAAGEVASEIAVDTVSNAYYQDDGEDVAESLMRAIRRANAAIHARAAENMLRSGMGTTCVAAILLSKGAYIANVGDSRAYLVRNNEVRQVSQDHSWVAEQVRAGLLTEEQARTHAQRNVITRCLGTQAEVEIDVFTEELEEGDSLVLCTDGLSGLVSDDELLRIVNQYVPQESVYHLVERANENGGPDNITAIVVRVQEVGVEPPNVRHPVRVGGRETGEDTRVLGLFPGSTGVLSARNGEMQADTSAVGEVLKGAPQAPLHRPLRIVSGPLASSEQDVSGLIGTPTRSSPLMAPTGSVAQVPLSRRNRLLYPSLALLILMVVTLVSGGIYYFIHKSQDAEQVLSGASISINQAEKYLSSDPKNPGLALSQLAQVQDALRKAQKNHQFSDAQNQQAVALLTSLTKPVRTAIDTYNANANAQIKVLPCGDLTMPKIINEGSAGIPQSIASVQRDKATFLYALGPDPNNNNNIYVLNPGSNHYSVLSALTPSTTPPHVLSIAGDGNLLFALQAQTDPKNPYSVNLYRPEASGSLRSAGSAPITATLTQNSKLPIFITAWNSNLYVVLAAKGTPDNALLLNYSVNNGQLSQTPKQLSISGNITGITALPNQLFLLLADGSIKSLQFAPGSLPLPVLTQSILPPLATSDQPFTADMEVPVPPKQNPSQSLTSLSVAGATSLSAGIVKNTPHLYISDPMNHRIIDLIVAPGASPNATPGIVAPTQAAGTRSPTSPSTTAAPTATNVTLQLFQQNVSATYFGQMKSGNQVKSVAFDPQEMFIYVLIQNPPSQSNTSSFSLIWLSTGLQSNCLKQTGS